MSGEGSGDKCHSMFQAAQSLTATEIHFKNFRSVRGEKKEQIKPVVFIYLSNTSSKKNIINIWWRLLAVLEVCIW